MASGETPEAAPTAPPRVTLDSWVQRGPSVLSRRVGDSEVLVPTPTTPQEALSVYALNETGSFVWGLLDAEKPVCAGKLLQRVLEAYEVQAEEAERDLLEMLGDMVEAKVVKIAEPAEA